LLGREFSIQNWRSGERISSISFGFLAQTPFERTKVVKALNEANIENRMYSAGNIGRHPFFYERFGTFTHPMADQIHDCGLFVPNHQDITKEQVELISTIALNARR
jgi:CDP-4-dehydro-6-deoxyglucose reductase, E1